MAANPKRSGGDEADDDRLKRAKVADRDVAAAAAVADHPPATVVTTCATAAAAPRATVTPWIRFTPGAILFDRRLRTTFAAANPPLPTPTLLTFGCNAVGGVYARGGQITIVQGSLRVFTDAACTLPWPGIADPWTAGTIDIDNARLASFAPAYVLGGARGDVRLLLALDLDEAFMVNPPATAAALAVELTLELFRRAPNEAVMPPLRALGNGGRHVGVPANADIHSSRVHVRARASNPQGHGGRLVIQVRATDAGRLALFPNRVRTLGEADGFNVEFADADTDRWVAGLVAEPNGVVIGLGLRVGGATLAFGDCVRVRPIVEQPTSIGLEWENTSNLVQLHHSATGARITTTAFAASKATVFRSAVAPNMRVDTEINAAGQAYSEIVIGPAYNYTELEAMLAEVKRFVDAVILHRTCTARLPANIHSREAGNYATVLYLARRLVTFVNPYHQFGGTMQGTFAVPIWALATFIAELDGDDGSAAKTAAETWADAHAAADDACVGLITACEYYIRVFAGAPAVAAADGPKTRTTVMFRTDFCAMYAQLPAAQQAAFGVWAAGDARRGARLLPNGYACGGGFQPQGPQIGAWLDSVIAGGAGKDLMSPPPAFARHGTGEPIPYAMGLLGVDVVTQHVIAEYRVATWQTHTLNLYFTRVLDEWARRCELAGTATWVNTTGDWGPPPVGPARRHRGAAVAYTHIRAHPGDPNS